MNEDENDLPFFQSADCAAKTPVKIQVKGQAQSTQKKVFQNGE